ncbi:MAG TPA: DUF5016 domain-containing protein [Paludibacter sp.]|nr:DUF5016 domain-containing protein [Paludibacter sp.]
MKNIFKTTIFGLLTLVLASCQEDELRTHFPASMPIFKNAVVAENAIMYGDSISLSVEVSDPLTPLSTLEIKIVVGDEIVASEKVRTKGNSATYAQKYSIPFVAHMPEGAEVEVHLSTINVEGTHRDTVLLNTIASRPAIPSIYMVTPTTYAEMRLTDAANHIYTAEGLTLENEISFRLATKLNKFKKIDWTNPENMIFGWINNGVGLVDVTVNGTVVTVTGDVITLANPTLVGFKKITLDLFNFTVTGEGDKLTPATTMNTNNFATLQMTSVDHMNVATKEDWKSIKMYLGKDTEMTISGLTDVGNSMDPTFFEVVEGNKVKFLGETGVYMVYYLPRFDYVFVEQPDAVFPNALWLVGVGMGPARTPAVKTSSWNWNSPLEYRFCRKVSEGVFETVFYANHEVDPAAAEPWRLTFGVKFMHQRTWGNEESSQNYAMPNSYLFSPSPNDKGNFNGTPDFANLPGIYRFTININNKTTSFVKIK